VVHQYATWCNAEDCCCGNLQNEEILESAIVNLEDSFLVFQFL
jgi:hypothetical protein